MVEKTLPHRDVGAYGIDRTDESDGLMDKDWEWMEGCYKKTSFPCQYRHRLKGAGRQSLYAVESPLCQQHLHAG